MQLNIFDTDPETDLIEELFQAYFDCRKNKRNTLNALMFEKHLERNLFSLSDDLLNGSYAIGRSIAFIVNKPVKREIFAADFRDRVIHHLLINKLNPLFERIFIEDSYACRVGKGTHYGIRRLQQSIATCSSGFTRDCYVLKLDIQGFFMHINRELLLHRLYAFIEKRYRCSDRKMVIDLCRKIVLNDSTANCIVKGSKKNWAGLPNNKSLFHSPVDCGLPIGNLTSQVFANFYMSSFDDFIKKDLQIEFYGRYVDDFYILHKDKEYLKHLIPKIADYLKNELHLTLHPRKIYLQHYSKGVSFIGAVIKPNRLYITNRIKGNFFAAIKKQNELVSSGGLRKSEKEMFVSSMNSYLGMMKHFNTFRLRSTMITKNLSPLWKEYVVLDRNYLKFKMIKQSPFTGESKK